MPNELNNVSPLERYLALKTIRDNVFYQKPLTYNSLDFADDLPGAIRGTSLWYSDVLPTLGVFSKNPEKRKAQIAKAVAKAKETKQSTGNSVRQALGNAAVVGLSGVPASAAISTIFRFLNPRSPIARGKLRNPFTLKKTLNTFKTKPKARKEMLKNIIDDSIKGGLMAGGFAAATPLVSGAVKPSDAALEEAGRIIAKSPNITALPPVDLVASINGPESSRLENTLLGGGIGATLGTTGAFIPASLNIPKHLIMGIIKRKLPIREIAKDFSSAAKTGVPLTAGILGATGTIGGALYPTTHKQNE